MSQLKEQIHMWGRCPSGPNKSQLLRGVRELIQPWEISLSLKKVTFHPNSQPSTIPFGEINVQEHSLSFPVGVCGPQGQKCAIHTGEMAHENRRRRERADSGLPKVEEERRTLKVGHLVKKFGKQGSGRTDFTLPSGVHATPQGQLFVVDCGNVRVQVTDLQRNVVQQVAPPACDGTSRHCRNFFDVAANSKGLIALTCAAERALLVFNRHGRLLQTYGGSGSQQDFEAPRGVTLTRLDDFLVADIRRGTLTALKLDPKTGAKMERTVVTGFHRPYLVAACLTTGLMVVSERGNETGRAPCIRVLEPGWNTIRILGVCSGMGPVLTSPWGICIDTDGDVLVADWGKQHCVVLYPAVGVGRSIITQGLSSPRGLALLPEGHLVVSDSMNHCIKIYRYK
uniref:NHL repeat containing E3 ubiquitin protein ligase 1 n=1 Tax=Pygocentrus nattereri TaxID=42514 RepID=A0AAR2L6K6_PYGNA